MYSANVVLINWAVVLTVASGVSITRGLTSEAGAVLLALCPLAGALTTLLGIIRFFPR